MPLEVFSLSFFQFCSPFCANFILHEAGEDVRDLCLHDPVVTQGGNRFFILRENSKFWIECPLGTDHFWSGRWKTDGL